MYSGAVWSLGNQIAGGMSYGTVVEVGPSHWGRSDGMGEVRAVLKWSRVISALCELD